jgi:hypothetical protein
MAGSVDRRLILAGGAALALAAGLIAAAILGGRGKGPVPAPPASRGGLMVQSGRDDDIKLDPKRPLRCFVAGRLIGELPLGECAKRNGVATGALDVGLDPSGAPWPHPPSRSPPLPRGRRPRPRRSTPLRSWPGPSRRSAGATPAQRGTPWRGP